MLPTWFTARWRFVCALTRTFVLAAFGVALVMASSSNAASSSVTIDMGISSATVLDTIGCLPGMPDRTSFGTVQPGTPMITGTDCSVLFGSSNDTSTLRAYQSDGRGVAMMQAPTTTAGTSSDYRIKDMDLATASIGWSVSDGPSSSTRVFKTTDGGSSWTGVADTDLTEQLGSVDAVSTTVAWATSLYTASVFRTTDGSNWAATSPAPAGAYLTSITAADATTAWLSGHEIVAGHYQPRIWRTTNGGSSWTLVYSDPTNDIDMLSVEATSTTNVWAAYSTGKFFHATDGVTFVQSGGSFGSFTGFDVLDANRIAAATGLGSLIVTTTAGGAWTTRPSIERGQVSNITWSPNGDIYMVGQLGSIQRTTDQGVTWTTISNPYEGTTFLSTTSPAASQLVVGMNSRTTLLTTDAGSTWSQWKHAPAPLNYRDIDGMDASHLWAVAGGGAISKSADGGSTWTPQTSPTTNALYEVIALDTQTAVAVGAGGTIVRTSDGGTTWTTQASGTTTRLRTINASGDGRTLLAGGDNGTLVVSTNAGVTWSSAPSGITDAITAVGVWSASNWIIGTSIATVRSTTNAGSSWTPIGTTGANETIADIATVAGAGIAYVLWDDNVSRTDDYGATWTSTDLPNGGQLFSLDVGDPAGTVVWVSGQYGHLMRSADSGSTWTQLSGSPSSTMLQGITALGPYAAVAASDGNRATYTVETTTIPDYSGTQWGTSSGLFGICLRSAAGASNTWPTTGSCPQTDGTNWRAVPLNAGLAASKVGDLTAPGTTTANFRFGMRAPATQTPGTYQVSIAFELLAPSA